MSGEADSGGLWADWGEAPQSDTRGYNPAGDRELVVSGPVFGKQSEAKPEARSEPAASDDGDYDPEAQSAIDDVRRQWPDADARLDRGRKLVAELPSAQAEALSALTFRSGQKLFNSPAFIAWASDPDRTAADLKALSTDPAKLEIQLERRITALEVELRSLWKSEQDPARLRRQLQQLINLRIAANA